MKKIVIVNYWLILVSWSLILNGLNILGEVVIAVSCLMLLKSRKANCFRVVILSLTCYMLSLFLLNNSRIPYFFPELSIHLLIVSFNCFITYEYLLGFNKSFILPVIYIIVLSILFISGLIVIIPGEYYSLIGKNSLLLLEAFIFLPYLISSLICVVSKAYRPSHNTYIVNNELHL